MSFVKKPGLPERLLGHSERGVQSVTELPVMAIPLAVPVGGNGGPADVNSHPPGATRAPSFADLPRFRIDV